jgi:hypothetical protein
MARAFPEINPFKRINYVNQVFEDLSTLDEICLASGGHVRNLLRLAFSCIQRMDPPFSRECVEGVIRQRRNELLNTLTADEIELLRQVKANKKTRGEASYETLLKSMFVFEYRNTDGHWFDVNPILYDEI